MVFIKGQSSHCGPDLIIGLNKWQDTVGGPGLISGLNHKDA